MIIFLVFLGRAAWRGWRQAVCSAIGLSTTLALAFFHSLAVPPINSPDLGILAVLAGLVFSLLIFAFARVVPAGSGDYPWRYWYAQPQPDLVACPLMGCAFRNDVPDTIAHGSWRIHIRSLTGRPFSVCSACRCAMPCTLLVPLNLAHLKINMPSRKIWDGMFRSTNKCI